MTSSDRERGTLGPLAGPLLIAMTIAWLPGQLQASTARWWLLGGVLPLVVALRACSAGMARLPGWGVTALPLAALAAWSALSALWVPAPGAALRVALLQLGWAAAALVGLASGLGGPGGRAARRGASAEDPDRAGAALAPGRETDGDDPGERGPANIGRWAAAAGLVAASPALWIAGGTFGNKSLLAGFLGPCVILVLTSIPALHGRWRLLAVASATAQAAALALAGSLAGAAAVAVGLAAWVALPPPTGRRRPARLLAVPAAAAVILLLPDLAPHTLGRAQLARITSAVAVDALPFGVGAGQLQGAFLEAQAARLASGTADPALWSNVAHAHNEPLHALAEHGILGLMLLVPFVAAFARPRRSAPRATLAAAAAVALVSPALYEPATATLAALCVGLCVAELASRRTAAAGTRRSPRWTAHPAARALVVTTMTLTAVLATAHLLGDRLTVLGARRSAPDTLRLAAALSLTPEPAMRANADRLLPAHPTRARLLAEEAVHRAPTPVGWLLVGRSLLAAFEPAEAVRACENAARLHPRLFAAWVNLSLARAEARDPGGARLAADRARRLRPDDPRLEWLPQ